MVFTMVPRCGTEYYYFDLRTEISLVSSPLAAPHLDVKYSSVSRGEPSEHSVLYVPAEAILQEPSLDEVPAEDEAWINKLAYANGGNPMETVNPATRLTLHVDPARVIFRLLCDTGKLVDVPEELCASVLTTRSRTRRRRASTIPAAVAKRTPVYDRNKRLLST